MALSAGDESGYFKNSYIVRQSALSNAHLVQSGFVIEITLGDPCRSEMWLRAIRTEAQGCVARSFRKRHTSRTGINPKKEKIGLGSRQLTIGEQEGRVECYGLIQQPYCLADILEK